VEAGIQHSGVLDVSIAKIATIFSTSQACSERYFGVGTNHTLPLFVGFVCRDQIARLTARSGGNSGG